MSTEHESSESPVAPKFVDRFDEVVLGLFAFALSHPGPHPKLDRWTPWVAVLAPLAGWTLEQAAVAQGFSFGFALLPVNGFLTWFGAWMVFQVMRKR